MSRAVYVNGKFTAQRTTGVQRLGRELLVAIDRRLQDEPADGRAPWILQHPAGGRPPELGAIRCRPVRSPWRSLHAWEQVVLPLASRDGLLVSLAGTAPLARRFQVCTLPDAAVFDHPEAYTGAFATWYRFAFRWLSRHAALILTISRFSKERLLHWIPVLAKREVCIVPCGADQLDAVETSDAAIERHGLSPGRYLLAVGSANPTKNFATLMRAFASLDPGLGVRLAIVGGGNSAVFSHRPAEQSQGVVSLGVVSDAELKGLYASALGFVFPSLYEGFGLPPLEAMACGCPVAASRAASIPEVCGDAALYFDPRSESDMAAAMRRLALEPDLRADLRERGRRRLVDFDWDAAAVQVLARVRSLVATPEARR